MKVAWNTQYCHPLPDKHRFPMEKYQLLPQQLLREGIIEEQDIFNPGELSEKHILAVHHHHYWEKLKTLQLTNQEIRRTGFPLSRQLIERETSIARGTVEIALFALQYGVAFNVAGGTHHAGRNYGEGFCLLNDIAIAARYLINQGLAQRILVIDLDVHQGNGTADIFQDDASVITFSMHGAKNFPHKKSHSDRDVPLADGTDDEAYLSILAQQLEEFCHNSAADFVFYQAGVDVLESDALGRLGLTANGCKLRDRMVLEFCRKRSLPVAVVMGGGYSPKIATIIEAHANTYRIARELFY